jgi:tRNA threonylcarbamoyladenosine biosynthesis protein TsaE
VAIILIIQLNSEVDMQDFARQLAQHSQGLKQTLVIYLEGDLGAGKTTLARSFIQFFGFNRVKSPTYSLVESYVNSAISIHHFDCYRLSDPEELDYIGIRDYAKSNTIQLIEWAELGTGMLALPDMIIKISGEDEARELAIQTPSKIGEKLLTALNIQPKR